MPAYVVAVGQRVAAEKHLQEADLARLTTDTALRFFGMGPVTGEAAAGGGDSG